MNHHGKETINIKSFIILLQRLSNIHLITTIISFKQVSNIILYYIFLLYGKLIYHKNSDMLFQPHKIVGAI